MNKKLYTTTDIVKELLEKEPQTRNSDNYLYMRVLQVVGKRQGIDVDNMPVLRFFLHIRELDLPSIETVGRCRRKLQEEHPELTADRKVEEQRASNEEIFRSYARSVV